MATAFIRVVAIAAIAVFVWIAMDLALIVFAAIQFAILLRTLACWTSDRLHVPMGAALTGVLLTIVTVLVAAGVFYAPALAEQADELTTTLPAAFNDVTDWMRQYEWGRWLLDELTATGVSGEQVVDRATRAAGTIMNGMVAAIVIVFAGVYLAADPRPYLRGALWLFPAHRRRRIAEVVFAMGYTLRWWLVGQAVAMGLVGLAMGVGLALIGVPLALALGVIAGFLEFVPVLGPMLAVGPALLLAAAEGTGQTAKVLALYAVVQTAESYLMTPLLQRRVVHLPPVVTISAQVALSWAAGALGLLLAVPMTAAALVGIQMLYVKDWLGSHMDLDAEAAGKEELGSAPYLHDLVSEQAA